MSQDASYFMIGEFADICGIKKQTLIHYDEIDLLKPSIRTQNNKYRYYALDAFETIFSIKSLQELGLPLTVIKAYLNDKNPDKFLYLLKNQLHEINWRIGELERIQSVVQDKIRVTQQSIELNKVCVEKRPQEAFLVTQFADKSIFPSKAFSTRIMCHIKNCQQKGLKGIFSTGVIFQYTDIIYGHYNRTNTFFTRVPEGISIPIDLILEVAYYASIYYRGDYAPSPETYERLFDFVESNDWVIVSNFFEESILDSNSVEGYENYLYKVSVAIQSANSSAMTEPVV